MTPNEVLLRASNVTKSFAAPNGQRIKVLDNLNFEICRQSLVVIRGDSGSGKSTLLRIFGLIDTEFEGELEICGTKTQGDDHRLSSAEIESLRARNIGFVFQDDLLLPLLNLRENSELPARIHHFDKMEIEKRLGWLQGLIFRPEELSEDVMSRRRIRVSGGQRQRAAILRAVSHGPQLIFADEPTASLDQDSKAKVLLGLKKLCQAGATVLVASHDSIFLNEEHVYELSDGKLSAVGMASERNIPTVELEETTDKPPIRLVKGGSLHRGCPPSLQLKIGIREALGNPLFAIMIIAALAAGIFQLTMLWSLQSGTEQLLDEVINQGSRLDRITVSARAQSESAGADGGLPSETLLANIGTRHRSTARREILLRVDDSRGRERQETAFGLIPDDPEIEKLDINQGMAFDDQHALAVLITERSIERLFGKSAIDDQVVGKSIQIRLRRYVSPEDETNQLFSTEELQLEEIELPFIVQGVLARAEAGRNFYLPQGTLLAIASWQMEPKVRLDDASGKLVLDFPPGLKTPPMERLHLYFRDLDEVLPAVSLLERNGYATSAELVRYRWILDTRRFANWTILGIITMVIGIAGLLVMSNVISSVRLKRKEIAVLKLMGMTNRDVVSIFVVSVLVCAVPGCAMGFLSGSALVDWIREYLSTTYPESPLGQVFRPTWDRSLHAFSLCAVVTVGFTIFPAWRTAATEAVWTID